MIARAPALLCLVPLAVVLGRDVMEGRAALREADALADRGDLEAVDRRVAALERAARRLAGPSARARRTLAELGRQGAPGAWQALRAAILETRWLVTPDAALLDEADRAIARQLALAIVAGGRPGGAVPDEAAVAAEASRQLARLRTTGEPSRPLALVGLAGLGAFLAGLASLAARGRSSRALALAGSGLLALVLGLWRA